MAGVHATPDVARLKYSSKLTWLLVTVHPIFSDEANLFILPYDIDGIKIFKLRQKLRVVEDIKSHLHSRSFFRERGVDGLHSAVWSALQLLKVRPV